MRIEIPHREPLTLTHVVFDLNGTLTVDGELIPGVVERFPDVCEQYQCWLVSADTLGRAEHWASALQVPLRVVATGEENANFVKTLKGGVAAVGNGCNDVAMFRCADLGIAVVGPEGASGALLRHADVVMPSIAEVFNFLLNPKRIASTLRP